MSIEKNIETLANNSERIAAALEGILAELKTANTRTPSAERSSVTSSKDNSEADAEAAAKAEKAKKAAAAKAAKAAAEAAAQAAKDEEVSAAGDKKGEAVSYDSIKAVVTELAGLGADGITAVKGVLKSYGAAKASDVPEEKWAELLAKFEKAKADLANGGEADLA